MLRTGRERVGWLLLGLVALAPLAFGIKGLITGAPGNPLVVRRLTGLGWEQLQSAEPGVGRLLVLLARHEAVALLGWGFWLAWTSVYGYRTGARWLWYGWWTVPILIVAFVLTGEGAGGALRPILLGFAVLSMVGLILSRRE